MKTTQTLNRNTPNRRQVLGGLGAGVLAAPVVLSPSRALAAHPLVLVTWGGSYAEIIQSVIVDPFTSDTGIPMSLVSGPDLAKAKAQVTTGNLEWDLFDGSGGTLLNAANEGLFEELDTSIIDTSNLVARATPHCMPFLIYAGGIAYDRARTDNPAQTFAQLWDESNHPGRIGLRTRVSETLELALLADGVDPANLYPLDVERAFASLEKVKSRVAKWIDQTPQTISLLTSGEIDYSYTYNGRVATAQKEGLSVAFATDQSLLLTQYYSVLKGSKKRDEAMQFIEFACRPEIQANLANAYSSVPVRPGVLETLSEEVRANLPDPANPATVLVKEEFWADKFTDLDRQFKEWLLT